MQVTLDEIRRVRAEADCVVTPERVERAMDALAAAITLSLADANPLVYCVMNGGLMTASALLARLDFPLELAYLHATRYGQQLHGTCLDWRVRPTQDLRGRSILVVDDILDEGYTLDAIVDYLRGEGAASVQTAVLVHKLHERKALPGMRADFTGLEVEDRYLFGCGMDYKGYWRNLPGIYALKGG